MKKLWACIAVILMGSPVLAERYKALPTARDNAEMEATLAPGNEVALDDFLKNPAKHHWVAFYEAADQLFAQGKKDDALMYYYVGQLRGRVAAGIDPDPSRNNALLASLNYGIGKPIMEYARGDKANWGKQIDRALAWDKAHPLPADPKHVIGISEVAWDRANFQALYDEVRAGLLEMRSGLPVPHI